MYAQIIGNLMYLMNCRKPDDYHLTTVARMAKYLRGTIDYRLKYGRSP